MATEFRPLNETEIHALKRAIEKDEIGMFAADYSIKELRVSYERISGGFCVCIIVARESKKYPPVLFRGASRQSMHDKPNRIKGDMLAFNRAIRDSKPVTL